MVFYSDLKPGDLLLPTRSNDLPVTWKVVICNADYFIVKHSVLYRIYQPRGRDFNYHYAKMPDPESIPADLN